MLAPTMTGEAFLDAIVGCGLLDDSRLAAYRDGSDPTLVARRLVKDRLLTPFQARTLLMGRPPAFFLGGRYKLLEHLGTGGMGDVYLAEHLLLRRVAALKLVLYGPHGTRGSTAMERFFREARAVAALDHPNVVRVFDMDHTPAGPFLAMEYVDGTNLYTLVQKGGPMDPARAADAAKQAAAGLGHAHAAGIIHRDVKPGNLLLDRQGTVKVVDLGLARHRDPNRNAGITAQGADADQLLGTVNYLAPEQAMDSGAVDARADVYALGATLYYLLTGQAPFATGSTAQRLVAHQTLTPAPPDKVRPDVPPELSELVLRMMAKRPADRPQTMDAVADALADWVPDRLPAPDPGEMPKHPPSAYLLGLCAAPANPVAPAAVPPRSSSIRPVTSLAAATPSPVSAILPSGVWPGPASSAGLPLAGPASPVLYPGPGSSAGSPTPPSGGYPAPPTPPASGTPASGLVPPDAGLTVSRRQLLLVGAGLAGGTLAFALWPARPPVVVLQQPQPAVPPAPPPEPPPTPAPVGLVVNGSGSSFIGPVMGRWAEEYKKATQVDIRYRPIGSGKGVDNMIEGVSEFGCTDAYMRDDQLARAEKAGGQVLHIPLALGAVGVVYNLPDRPRNWTLRITGRLLAEIYLGVVTHWDDERIAVHNNVKLPHERIVPVRRSGASGTTAIWTEYLADVSSEWKAAVGPGGSTTERWPKGDWLPGGKWQEADKNATLVDLVSGTPMSIGYVETASGLGEGLRPAELKNRAGNWVAPTLTGVTAAAAALREIKPDLRFSLVNQPGDDVYPVAGCTWAVLYKNLAKAGPAGVELVRFLRWAVHDGQGLLAGLRFATLPPALVKRVDELLATVRTG